MYEGKDRGVNSAAVVSEPPLSLSTSTRVVSTETHMYKHRLSNPLVGEQQTFSRGHTSRLFWLNPEFRVTHSR